ncbi:MFS transporter [Actinoplanes sp. CA-051413]|uniref:MFS transporter n=1 Tax=Actinoplanes sp. CA-051413 TaxID=3239899 RepID=UPI003D979F64
MRAAQTLPFLLLAVPVGLLVDRVSRRRLLLIADTARFPLAVAIAVAAALHVLTLGWLVALVLLVAVFTVLYEVTYLSVLPQLVDRPDRLPHANRAVEVAHAGAALVGPGVGGALVGALTAAGVVLLDALSFLAGALLTAVNRWPSPVPAPDRRTSRPGAGWAWLWRDRYVRPMTLYLAVNNLAAQAFQTALLLFVLGPLGLPAAAVGVAVAAFGGGFLLGALISPAAAGRLGIGRVVVTAAVAAAAGMGLVAAGSGLIMVVAGALFAGTGPGMLNLHSIALRQAMTPGALLGRVNAVVKTISYGATTVGALAGGMAATGIGPRLVIAFAAAVSAGAALIPACSAIRSLKGLPAT